MLRPNVVLFGEPLPSAEWDVAIETITRADLVLVIGTSLQVAPVNRLPFLTDGKLLFLNTETIGEERSFDVVIQGRVKETLPALDRWVRYCEREERR